MARVVNTEEHDRHRRELARAVHRTVGRVGIERASMRAIAREAGVTTGALTHYFADRRALMEHALGLVVSETMERVVATARGGSLLDALCELLPLDEDRRLEGVAWLVSIDAASRDPALAAALAQRYATARDLLAGLLRERSQAAGHALAPDELDLLADEVVTAVDGVATYGLAEPERYTPQRQRRLVARVLERVGLADGSGP